MLVFLPDLLLPPPRSFSELYVLSLQEPSRRGAPEPVPDEAPAVALLATTKQLLQVCLNDGSGPPGPGDLAEERTEFLHSQNPPSPCRCALSACPLLWPTRLDGKASASRVHGSGQLAVLSRPCSPQLPVRRGPSPARHHPGPPPCHHSQAGSTRCWQGDTPHPGEQKQCSGT